MFCFTSIFIIHSPRRATSERHKDDIRVHTKSDTDGIRVHTNDTQMTCEYIRVTYGWHTSIYDWHTNNIRITYEWNVNDIRTVKPCKGFGAFRS